jgi:hypothetical protein
MTTTTIRTTCSSCGLTFDVPSGSLVLALPAPSDTTAEPSFVHVCPSCLACEPVTVPWRTATYLLDAGATTLTAPELAEVAPRYPELRPAATGPMTLDDLIDLFAVLDADTSTR